MIFHPLHTVQHTEKCFLSPVHDVQRTEMGFFGHKNILQVGQ